MPRPSNRERLLHAGLHVVHARGFGAASVRDIVRAAGVPQGSFTNHWASKEAFGLAVLDVYSAGIDSLVARTLCAPDQPALERIRAYVAAIRTETGGTGVACGCLLGNMSAEAEHAGEVIRLRVVAIFATVRDRIASCLCDAVAEGAMPSGTECADLAGTILSSLQGAILLAKAQRSEEPVAAFERFLFTVVLPPAPARYSG